MTYTGHFVL